MSLYSASWHASDGDSLDGGFNSANSHKFLFNMSSHRITCNGFDIIVAVQVNIVEKQSREMEGVEISVSKAKEGSTCASISKSKNKENCVPSSTTNGKKEVLGVHGLASQDKVPYKKRTLADLLNGDDESVDLLTSDDLISRGAKRIDGGGKKGGGGGGGGADSDGWYTARKNKTWLE